ncbi:MAG: hypothetical protein Q8O30_08215 [Candidatus Omnitrophota bacterium]|nr:hypothetical protein [Candidatus Omnitrophota bacterium]
METTRVKGLVAEFHLAKKRIEELKEAYERAQISFEIAKDLEKDLHHEAKAAHDSRNSSMLQCWQDVINECFHNDKDIAKKEDLDKIKAEFIAKNEKLLMYYEKKIKIIKRLLGARLAQILENYEEKNILMGGERSSTKVFHEIEEEEDELEKKQKERKNSATFDKM